MQTEKSFNNIVIHGFAALHAVTTIACHTAGLDDSIFLTVWTMAMTVLLCNNKRLSVEFIAVTVILVNIIGFVIGVAAARCIQLFMTGDIPVHAISTFLTTECMGLALVLLVPDNHEESAKTEKTSWLWSVVIGVLTARLIIGLLASSDIFSSTPMQVILPLVLSNSVVLLFLVCANIVLLHRIYRGEGFRNRRSSILWHTVVFLPCPAICVLLIYIGIPVKADIELGPTQISELFVLTFIVQLAVYSVIYLIYYITSTRRKMEAERSKGLIAKLEYQNLKQQVNPHFLFNSLNVLDALVAEGKTEQARSFNRKLSDIYRYMLSTENEILIPLSDELEYVNRFTDLLKVRFPEGLEIETVIDDPALYRRHVVKFSVQMLVENAYKHNSISKSSPLKITIRADGSMITVTNTRSPRLGSVESTGLGIKYIRQNYLANGGKDIKVVENNEIYSVSLPIL